MAHSPVRMGSSDDWTGYWVFQMAHTNGRTAYLPVRMAHQNFQMGSPNNWTAYTENYLETTALYNRPSSFFWNETSIWIVSIITTICEHAFLFWDCNFFQNHSTLIESFFKTRSIALSIRKQLYANLKFDPPGIMNTRWKLHDGWF